VPPAPPLTPLLFQGRPAPESPGKLKSIRNYLIKLLINKMAKLPVSAQKTVLGFLL